MVGIWGCVVMWLESGCSWGGGFYIHNPMRMIEGERVRCRYTNQFISRCDDLIESVLGEGLCMYIGRVPTAWHASLAITDSTCAITRTLEEQHCMSCEVCHRGGQDRTSGGCQTLPRAKVNLSLWTSWSHMEVWRCRPTHSYLLHLMQVEASWNVLAHAQKPDFGFGETDESI